MRRNKNCKVIAANNSLI